MGHPDFTPDQQQRFMGEAMTLAWQNVTDKAARPVRKRTTSKPKARK